MSPPQPVIVEATQNHLPALTETFGQYLAFYNVEHPVEQVHSFLKERIANRDSALFVAELNGEIAGFIQLYLSFTSLQLGRFWVLNDLFVSEKFRNKGLAPQLLSRAKQLLIDTGAKAMMLDTQISNSKARKLYEDFGFVQNQESVYYYLWV